MTFIIKKYVISFVQPYCMWSLGKNFLTRVTNSKFWAVWLFQLHHICPNYFGYVQIGLSKIYCQNVRSKLSYELAIIASRVAPLLLGTTPTAVALLVIYSCKFHVCIGLMKEYWVEIASWVIFLHELPDNPGRQRADNCQLGCPTRSEFYFGGPASNLYLFHFWLDQWMN